MKKNYAGFYYLESNTCHICGCLEQRILGVRGNREYRGAEQTATPHVYTNVVKCTNCDFIFCNPSIKGLEHLELDHYNDPVIYGDYLKGNIFSVYSVGEQIIRTFKPTGRLLDIGAGKGDFLSLASKQGYHSKGIEPSPRFCQHAREKYGAHIAQGFLGDEGCFNGERFDIVTMFHVLEHVKTPQKLLATVSTHLEKNGIIYIEVPNADATLLKIADALFRISGKKWSTRLSPLHEPFHAVGYSPKSLTYLLKKNGFDIVYIDTFSGNVRGYETSGKFAFFTALARNIVSKLVNLLGNRDLISVVVKKNPYNSF